MNALQGLERYQKEVIQVSTQKNDLKVQYLYDSKDSAYNIAMLRHLNIIF